MLAAVIRVKYKNLERSQEYVCVRIKYTFFYLFVLNVFFKYIWLYNPLHMWRNESNEMAYSISKNRCSWHLIYQLLYW